MINFMLPVQLGAMTFDGTWLIALGILAVAGILYNNRNNISLTSTESNINENDNLNTNIQLEENAVEDSEVNENTNTTVNKDMLESAEALNQETEELIT